MTLLRRYELYVGINKELNELREEVVAKAEVISKPATDATVTKSDVFYKTTDLQITAQIDVPREGKGSKVVSQTVKVTNPDTVLIDNAKRGSVVILKAGYNTSSQLPIILAADITYSVVEQVGTEQVLTMICGEGYVLRNNIHFPKEYPTATKFSTIINDIIKVFASKGISLGRLDKSSMYETPIKAAQAFTGLVGSTFDDVCSASKHRWYITGGKLYIEPTGETERIEVLEVEEDTVLGHIGLFESTASKTPKEKKVKTRGIKVKVMLDGNLSKVGGISVKFGAFKGRYKVTKVTHKLDYEGAGWHTEIEAAAV